MSIGYIRFIIKIQYYVLLQKNLQKKEKEKKKS
jgi:hypothetical protein